MADASALLAELKPGLSVYVQGGGGEPLALRDIVNAAPEALAGIRLTSCLLPGINDFDYAAVHADAHLTVFMLPPRLWGSFEGGWVTWRPLSYSQIALAMLTDPPFDLAILQVCPPDDGGNCSFGPCADFAPLVWPRARRIAAFVNPRMPRARRGPSIPASRIDVAIEADGPFITGVEAGASPEQAAIAQRIATLVPDGAAIQSGIGGAPAAAIARLADRRNLIVRSGMVTEGYRRLAEAGALAAKARHVTGLAYGSGEFMAWACERFIFEDATVTHGAAALARAGPLFAINSALEVDLFGQANVEWQGGRPISGLGGAPDFARAARRSNGGRAILALPATARGGSVSRIVARVSSPTVSIPRDDTDVVITEHGVADLRGTSLDARAEALIAVAAPAFRDRLAADWAALRRGM